MIIILRMGKKMTFDAGFYMWERKNVKGKAR